MAGELFLFARWLTDNGRNQLMIVRSDGTGLHALLPGVDASGPNWSPNSTRSCSVGSHHENPWKFHAARIQPILRECDVLTVGRERGVNAP
jgi:hypothetical protein